MRILILVILFMMNQCSSLVCLMHGMDILFPTSKPNAFIMVFHVMNDITLDTIQSTTLSLETPCTIMTLILFYDIS
jgi:hypothetical protein